MNILIQYTHGIPVLDRVSEIVDIAYDAQRSRRHRMPHHSISAAYLMAELASPRAGRCRFATSRSGAPRPSGRSASPGS